MLNNTKLALIYVECTPKTSPSATSRIVSQIPTPVTQTPSNMAMTSSPSSQKSKSRIQVMIPFSPPPKDLVVIKDQPLSSKSAAPSPKEMIATTIVEKRQHTLGTLDKKTSTLSANNGSAVSLPTGTDRNSLAMGPNQPSEKVNGPEALHSPAMLARNQKPADEALEQTNLPIVPEVLQTSLVKPATNYPLNYTSNTSPHSWPVAIASSAEMTEQKSQQNGTTLQNIPFPHGISPQNRETISAKNYPQSQTQHGMLPRPPKRKHTDIIDLTGDVPYRSYKKTQTTSSGSGNLERPDKPWNSSSQQKNRNKGNLVQHNSAAAPMVPMVHPSVGSTHRRPPILPPQLAQQFHYQFHNASQPWLNSPPAGLVNYHPVHTKSVSGVILPDRFQFLDNIVKPMRYSSASNAPYDPRSIAKSILLATNSHPIEQGLNSHYQKLLRYKAVDDSSDLSTFRWDLVDPDPVEVGPTGQQTTHRQQFGNMPPVGPNDGKQQLPIHGSQPKIQGTYSQNATPGQSNTMYIKDARSPPIVIPSDTLSRSLVGFGTSLGVGNITPRAPVPSPATNNIVKAVQPHKDWPPEFPVHPRREMLAKFSPRPQPKPLTNIAVEIRSPTSFVSAPDTEPKKRGRPSKNPEATPLVQSLPKKRGRPFRDPEAALAAAAKKARAAAGLPKKRGRPLKNPLEMVEIPLRSPKFLVFKCEWSGCNAELHNLEVLRQHLSTVHGKMQNSNALTCSWGNCGKPSSNKSAQKQESSLLSMKGIASNADQSSTAEMIKLPKDYYKTVKDVRGPLINKDVTREETYTSRAVEVSLQRFEFKSRFEWEAHIEHAHMVPYAWHMGDGPRGTSLSKTSLEQSTFVTDLFSTGPSTGVDSKKPLWLYDKDGNQVIDSVKDQKIEDGKPSKNNERRFKRVLEGIHIVLQPVKNPEAYQVYDYED